MRILSSTAIVTLILGGSAFGANKEMQELQRDIAQLQSQVQALQSSQDQKMAAIQALVTQALDAAGKANTAVSVLSATVNQTLERELKSQMTPVAGLAAKVDNTNNDVADIRNSVTDLNTTMNKILQRLGDLNDAVKVIQAPAPPPPGSPTAGVPTGGAPAAVAPPPASTVYTNAYRDQVGGKIDLAISEYSEFLKLYPDDPNAANAQLQIGIMHQQQNKYELAAQDFDAVIERYPDGSVTPDAYLMKGMALKTAGRRADAIATFRALINNYPRKDQASQAKDQLRAMNVSVASSAPPASSTRKKK